MITPSAILFATVALSAISSLGAPIPKVTRDVVGPETQPIGRRFPQPIAADSPELVKKSVENPPSADAIVRRFPRRVYYEYYNKRDVEVVERSPEPAPEPAPVPEPAPAPIPVPASAPAVTEPKLRSLEDLASEELAARTQRRTTRRRSTDKTYYKRTLASEGVRVRSPREEPRSQKRATNDAMKQAREVPVPIVAREPAPAPAPIVAREPTPAPVPVPEPVAVKESRAFIPPLEKRDSMIPPAIKESRAFIPRAPDAVDARDTFVWEINNGVSVNVDVSDVEVTKIKCMVSGTNGNGCPSSPADGQNGTPSTTTATSSSTGTSTGSSTGTSTGSSTTGSSTTGSTGDTTSTTTATSSSTGTSTGSSTTSSSTSGSSTTGSSSTNPADQAGGKGGKGSSGTGSTTTISPSSTSPCTGTGTGCTTTGSTMSGTKKTPTVNTPETTNPNPESTNPSPRDASEAYAPPPRRASAKWRRITPAPSLSRRTKSGSAIQFRREH